MSKSELIYTGILMGIIDVLTGPDHLSALATLCGTDIHSPDNSRRDAFLLGVRWGVGHSVGLLVVGGLLIAMEASSGEWIGMDPLASTILEGFVGVFMLGLGAYGLFKADRNRRESAVSNAMVETYRVSLESQSLKGDDDDQSADVEIVARMEGVLEVDSLHESSMRDVSMTSRLSAYDSRSSLQGLDSSSGSSQLNFFRGPIKRAPVEPLVKPPTPAKLMTATSLMNSHTSPDHSSVLLVSGAGARERCSYFFCGIGRFCEPRTLAVVSGVLHGVAGPGGVLGVVPAAQLRDAKLAILYLGAFCLSSTCVMGGFAAFYGSFSEWLAGGGQRKGGSRVFVVEVGSALLSVCVGFIWLILLSLGKLGDVFP